MELIAESVMDITSTNEDSSVICFEGLWANIKAYKQPNGVSKDAGILWRAQVLTKWKMEAMVSAL